MDFLVDLNVRFDVMWFTLIGLHYHYNGEKRCIHENTAIRNNAMSDSPDASRETVPRVWEIVEFIFMRSPELLNELVQAIWPNPSPVIQKKCGSRKRTLGKAHEQLAKSSPVRHRARETITITVSIPLCLIWKCCGCSAFFLTCC